MWIQSLNDILILIVKFTYYSLKWYNIAIKDELKGKKLWIECFYYKIYWKH